MDESSDEHEPSSVGGGYDPHQWEYSEIVKCWEHRNGEQDSTPDERPLSLVQRWIQVVRITGYSQVLWTLLKLPVLTA